MNLKVHYYRLSLPEISKQTLKTMKLIAVILFAACIHVSARGYSQITLSENNTPLQKVFKEIQKQSGYDFVCTYEILKAAGNVSVNVREVSLQKALEECLKGKSLTYVIIGKTVVVQSKEKDYYNAVNNSIALEPLPPPPIEIHGRVVNQQGNPLQNVSVLIAGTQIGTSTNIDGRFTLNAPNDKSIVLEISSVGYQSKRVNVGKQTEVNVVLELEISGLSDVVVIGYGTTRKKDLTGSVSQVKAGELESVPVSNLEEALKGRSSGVQVTNNSGAPGSRIQVRIRGGNSMIGSNMPLYVVDGFPVTGGIDFLNPADIESIDILKDASATAIYGSRGANGVVIITSKKGRKGQKNLISVNSYYGIQKDAKRYKLLNAKQYAIVANEWSKNGGQVPFFNVDSIQNPGTDWQDVIFRTAPIQTHTITFTGSSEKTRYSLSGNYYNQQGIIINSGIQRGSFRLNLEHDIKNWLNLSVNFNIARGEQFSVPVDNGNRGNTLYTGALSAPPVLPVYDSNGQYTRIEQVYSFGASDMRNPLIFSKPYKDKTLSNTILQNTTLGIKISDALSFKTLLGIEYQYISDDAFTPIIFENDRGSASLAQSYNNSFLNENTLNYSKNFAHEQKLNLLGGFTYQTYMNKSVNIAVSGFPNNITEDFNIGSAETISPPSSGISQWNLVSWLGRANYSIYNKYYITASVRADGSSRFGKDNKWGVFPSGAIAWRLSDESFMRNIKFINELKLRASYGITGNTALSPYQSLDRLSSVRYIITAQAENIGYAPSGISNSKLKWETTAQFDIGFDWEIIDNRLGFTFDYYKINTNNLLASVPLPPSVGFGSILQNIGEIQNQGIEFSVNANIFKKEFKWDVSAQISTNKNKVIELSGGKDIIPTGSAVELSGYNIARVGQPLGIFFGYIEDGLDDKGFIKYKDINNDGLINPLDRVIIGTPYPDFTFGFNSDFSYKNFDLNIFFEGVYGNDIVFQTAYTNLNSFQRGNNQFADLFGNYWTEDNPNPQAKYPKISAATQMLASDRFIEDGSYLRIKSLQLSYNIPTEKMKMSWLSKARIYFKANNLFTITNYSGINPDINTTGNDSQNIGSRLRMGTDTDGYPNAKIYAIGIQLDF